MLCCVLLLFAVAVLCPAADKSLKHISDLILTVIDKKSTARHQIGFFKTVNGFVHRFEGIKSAGEELK